MVLNEAGKVILTLWNELENRFSYIKTDTFVIMPNHIHGIIFIIGASLVGAQKKEQTYDIRAGTRPAPTTPPGNNNGTFKSLTAHEYIHGVTQHGWTPFSGTVWQRNFWEHIIRNEHDLKRIREYIIRNPLQWAEDDENPNNWV